MTSAAFVVVCDHGHAQKLITQTLTADVVLRCVFKFCVYSLFAGRRKTALCHVTVQLRYHKEAVAFKMC